MEKAKILYVDDEFLNLELFRANLSDQYTIFTAESGSNGLEILSEHSDILIVISDMKMPKMDGMEFIQLAQSRFPQVKFYILTGFDITDEIQYALNQGLIQKYFRKPFNMREIGFEMERALKA